MQFIINTVLKLLKWPLALLMILMFLPVLKADIFLIEKTFNSSFFMNFVLPMIAMISVWFFIPGLNGSHFAIFEHEFTHMFAALLTFHMPKSMVIESDKGGSFGYYGEGNWFITLAPYFLPTFPILMIIFSMIWHFLGKPIPDFFIPTLGTMFGYHIISNISQIHGEQTDFAKAGWIFSTFFLPTANFLTIGFVWAFAAGNMHGVTRWGHILIEETVLFIHRFF